MTAVLTKAVNRVMALWGGAKAPEIEREPLEVFSGMSIGPFPPGTYLTRSGQRVEYFGAGEGRFLPYGLRTGGWLPATGRWLTSGEDHGWDLMERQP